ncbi:HpkR [Pasteurella multocida subsp. gallicida str. Anand1_poultry]|nr:HpkR [Pasteurella multocida subsp. gallicida str. Anand1_poultry]
MYNLEQLKAFVAVCENGSISAAARKLGKAQSAVSSAVANLEIALNQTLFDRSKKRSPSYV